METKQETEPEVYYTGEYHYQLIEMKQVEYYSGFWSKFLTILSPQQTPVIFRHMKNKYAFVDISVCDLVWIIAILSITIGTAIGVLSGFIIDKRYEKRYENHHIISRYYHDSRQLPATEHPDYVKQINDIIPCADYARLMDWKLKKRFNTTTNYYYVAKRDGYEYLQEVSDEEYYRAVDKLKGREKAEKAHKLLQEYNKNRKSAVRN